MAIYTLSGTVVSLGTSAAIDFSGTETEILADFALDTYIEIAETETISDFGDQAEDAPFRALADARTRHLKDGADGGMATITMADMPEDPGQVALKAAAVPTNQAEYNLRFQWPNGATSYIRGPVMSFGRVNGARIAKRSAQIGNSYGEFIDPA